MNRENGMILSYHREDIWHVFIKWEKNLNKKKDKQKQKSYPCKCQTKNNNKETSKPLKLDRQI